MSEVKNEAEGKMVKKISYFLLFTLIFWVNLIVFAENNIIKTEEDLNAIIQSGQAQTVVIIGKLEYSLGKTTIGTIYIGTKPINIGLNALKEGIEISEFDRKYVELKGYIEDVRYKREQLVGTGPIFFITSIESIKEIENIEKK